MNTQSDYPPVVQLPTELSDEAAAELLDFLKQLTQTLESTYAAQLRRYYHSRDERQLDIWDEQDPPF